MKPVSLADISYSQALQILGMRKEALDSGEAPRLARHLLDDSYYLRDVGQDYVEKRSNFLKTVGNALSTPTGKATAIGAGLGALGGLGKTYADDEDDSYFGNAVTGALGGGAVGLGAGLAFNSKDRKALLDKAKSTYNSASNYLAETTGSTLPGAEPPSRVEQAMASDNPAAQQVAAYDKSKQDALKSRAYSAAYHTGALAPAAIGAKYTKPGLGNVDIVGNMTSNPQAVNWEQMANAKRNSQTFTAMDDLFPDKTIYQLSPTQKTPKPTPKPAPKPYTAPTLDELLATPGDNRILPRNASESMKNYVEAVNATNQPSPKNPTQAAQQAAEGTPTRQRPPASPSSVVPRSEVLRGTPEWQQTKKQLEALMESGGKKGAGVSDDAVTAFMQFSNASDPQKEKILRELGLEPGFFSGNVKNPELLAAIQRRGGNVPKDFSLTNRTTLPVTKAMAEAIESRSARPMVNVLKKAPKGKLAAIAALLGVGYGGMNMFGSGLKQNAQQLRQSAKTESDFAEALRKAISAQAANQPQ